VYIYISYTKEGCVYISYTKEGCVYIHHTHGDVGRTYDILLEDLGIRISGSGISVCACVCLPSTVFWNTILDLITHATHTRTRRRLYTLNPKPWAPNLSPKHKPCRHTRELTRLHTCWDVSIFKLSLCPYVCVLVCLCVCVCVCVCVSTCRCCARLPWSVWSNAPQFFGGQTEEEAPGTHTHAHTHM